MQKLMGLVIVVLAVGAIAFAMLRTQPEPGDTQMGPTPTPDNTALQQPSPQPAPARAEPRQEALTATPNVPVWTALPVASRVDTPPRPGKALTAELVKLDSHRIAVLNPGDRVTFDIPQLGTPVAARVAAVDTTVFGNRSVSGHVNDNDVLGFVVTLGENAVYATIGTPDGVYNLRGNRQLAWIVPARELTTASGGID